MKVIGFGQTKYFNTHSNVLKKINVQLNQNNECAVKYQNITDRPITKENFCAFETLVRKGKNFQLYTCKGLFSN